MQAELLTLKTDLHDLRKGLEAAKATETEHTQQSLKKIEEISQALQEFNHGARQADADFGSQMERMIRDVQELRGAVEVTEHRIGETDAKLTQTLNTRIEAIKTTGESGNAEAASTSAQTAAPKDKKELLAYGGKLMKDGKTNDARGIYRDVVRQWPKELGITDEALFQLGESYFNDKKFDAALREYIKVVDKFSAGELVDDAYYKIGLCSMEMGNFDDAQTFFTEVVTNYKKSPLYKQAKSKLDEATKRAEQERSKKSKGKKK